MNREMIRYKFSTTVSKFIDGEYLIFKPKAAPPWPVVFYLHGGNAADKMYWTEAPPKYAHLGKEYPFLLISPFCHGNNWNPNVLEALLNHIEENHSIDKDRVYVTGRSMGGTGTYLFAAHCPDRIAAIAPICGRNLTAYAKEIAPIPVQIHHSEDDTVVPYYDAEQMLEALKFNNGHTSNELVTYTGLGHQTFSYPEEDFDKVLEWLLTHKKERVTPTPQFRFL